MRRIRSVARFAVAAAAAGALITGAGAGVSGAQTPPDPLTVASSGSLSAGSTAQSPLYQGLLNAAFHAGMPVYGATAEMITCGQGYDFVLRFDRITDPAQLADGRSKVVVQGPALPDTFWRAANPAGGIDVLVNRRMEEVPYCGQIPVFDPSGHTLPMSPEPFMVSQTEPVAAIGFAR